MSTSTLPKGWRFWHGEPRVASRSIHGIKLQVSHQSVGLDIPEGHWKWWGPRKTEGTAPDASSAAAAAERAVVDFAKGLIAEVEG